MPKNGIITGPSHHKGGIEINVIQTGEQKWVEGGEYLICQNAIKSKNLHYFVNQTTKQILDSIHNEYNCPEFKSDLNASDFIVCKLTVNDTEIKTMSGTVQEILNILQSQNGCNSGSDHTNTTEMAKGGPVSNSNKNKMANKPKFSQNDKVYMFKDEPTLVINEVNEWADKSPTYDLKSIDGSILRNNISEQKLFVADPDISVGDEGMWHGGHRRVKYFDEIGNIAIVEVDENENEFGPIIMVSLSAFKKEFSKFPTQKKESDTTISTRDILSVALQDVIESNPSRKFGNMSLAEAKVLYGFKNTQVINDDFDENDTLIQNLKKSLDDMGYLGYDELNGDYKYGLTNEAVEFIVAVDARIETLKNISAGTDLFPEMANLTKNTTEKIYQDLKSCLIEEGDDENTFIFEDKEFTYSGNGGTERWRFLNFFKYGTTIEHIVKSKMGTKKPNIKITFDELVKMAQEDDLSIDGVETVDKLKHCIKLLKKCIDIIDLNTEKSTIIANSDENEALIKNALVKKNTLEDEWLFNIEILKKTLKTTTNIYEKEEINAAIITLNMLLNQNKELKQGGFVSDIDDQENIDKEIMETQFGKN